MCFLCEIIVIEVQLNQAVRVEADIPMMPQLPQHLDPDSINRIYPEVHHK